MVLKHKKMKAYNLDTPLLRFGLKGAYGAYTARTAITGSLILGNTGSGKTSSSGRMMAHRFLSEGWGGLVLTAKPDEAQLWKSYCEETGRLDDLIIIEPGGQHSFNFLEYESQTSENQKAITANIVEVLQTVIESGEDKQANRGDDSFWSNALAMLMGNTIDLILLAFGKLSVEKMYSIVQSLPKPGSPVVESDNKRAATAFEIAFNMAAKNVNAQIYKWNQNLTASEREAISDQESYDKAVSDAVSDVRLLNFLTEFFYDSFKNLSSKTRAIIEFMFSGFLYNLLREPMYSLFCNNSSTVVPEDCGQGKIIVVNLPVKKFQKAGKDAQLLMKYCWQRAMEKREITDSTKPVFLWMDEGHLFLHEKDQEFQTTARSSLIATVMLSQNLSNFYAAMGGSNNEHKVKSLLSTLSTKIFHCNGDADTNTYASDLIGESDFTDPSMSLSVGADSFSQTHNVSIKQLKFIPPSGFSRLRNGGPLNQYKVDAIIHCQGDPLFNGRNHKRIIFDQKQNNTHKN